MGHLFAKLINPIYASHLRALPLVEQIKVIVKSFGFFPLSVAVFCAEKLGVFGAPPPKLTVSPTAQKDHEARVAKLAEEIKSAKGHVSTSRPNTDRISSRIIGQRKHTVNTSEFKHIVSLDSPAQTITVEPGVRMLELSNFIEDRMIPVVPELDDLTVGGLLMGCGIESTSFKHGMFQEICVSYEIITASGEVKRVTKDSDPELFYTLPWSYGSLGMLVSAELQMMPMHDFMRLEVTHFKNRDDFCRAIETASENKSLEFVEGLAFSPTHHTLTVGTWATKVDGKAVVSLGRWKDPHFYALIQGCSASSIVVRTKEYLHRHSRGIFWELSYLCFWSNWAPFRWLMGWLYNPPQIRLIKKCQPSFTLRYFSETHVVQDYLLPLTKLKEVLDLGDSFVGVYPIWICPYLIKKHPVDGIMHGHADQDQMYIDVGYYGESRLRNFNMTKSLKDGERWLTDNQGYSMLYAVTAMNSEEFRKMFNHKVYDKLRKQHNAATRFPELYEKVKPR